MGLFQVKSETAVVEGQLNLKGEGRDNYRQEGELAIDYWQGDQRRHVISELQNRFPNTQRARQGQKIQPVAVPLTKRFVDETATIYNRRVDRALVNEDGDVQEEETEAYNRHLSEIQYNSTLQQVDQIVALRKVCGLWYQVKRGQMRPVVTMPHDIYPEAPEDAQFVDATDPRDYAGFVVELFWAGEDASKAQKRTFAHLTEEGTQFFEGRQPNKQDKLVGGFWQNPFAWEHLEGDANQKPKLVTHPGQMLTFWHDTKPLGSLFPDTDATIANANVELNVLLSVLFDTMRMQGYGIPVVGTMGGPTDARAKTPWGTRHPLMLKIGETADMLQAASTFSEQMDVLTNFVKLVAVLERLSPNDFAIEGNQIQSGVAKMMDSIPKMEAREERLKHRTFLEEHIAWPRERAILIYLGVLPASANALRKQVKFDGVRFPLTEDERAKKIETDLKHNFRTRAKILAEERGLSLEDAEAMIEEHMEANKGNGAEEKKEGPPQPPPQQGGLGLGLAGLVRGRPQAPQAREADEDEDE